MRRKQLAALLAVVAVWGIVYGMHAWSVVRFLGVHGLGAPVQAAQWFRQSDWRLTVGAFLLLVYGLRLVMLWIAAELLLLVSTLAHRVQAASLIGIFLLVLPSALWAIGVAVLRPVSLDYLLSLIEVFQAKAFIGYSGFVWYGILTALGIGCCALTSERWMRT